MTENKKEEVLRDNAIKELITMDLITVVDSEKKKYKINEKYFSQIKMIYPFTVAFVSSCILSKYLIPDEKFTPEFLTYLVAKTLSINILSDKLPIHYILELIARKDEKMEMITEILALAILSVMEK